MPSVQHQFLARVIPKVRGSSDVDDPVALRQQKLTEQANADTDPPHRVVHGCEVRRVDGFGFPVHDLAVRGSRPRRTVLYLHGGGYVEHADRAHWKYAVSLAERLGVRVVLPHYPLAPSATWREAHEPLATLFTHLAVESPHGVVLAGDSAGGGLALALAQTLARRSGPQPTHLSLVSPWLDLTGTTPGTDEASARDPWLRISRMHLYAQWWAGSDEPDRPEVSPLFGDLDGLPSTIMWCGTRDTFYPQCRALADRAREQGWDLEYVEEPDLLHVYPILPIPEARRALDQLARHLDWAR